MRAAIAALCLCLAPAQSDEYFNSDMYAAPEPGAKPGPGTVAIYHAGKGSVGAGYVQEHEPGEQAEFHLFVPAGLKKGQRYPLLIVWHGGKDGQSGKGFARAFAKVSTAEHPVFVLSPNMYACDGYDQLLAEGTHPIDPQRIVVMGFSSGGYGVGAAMAHIGRTEGAFRPQAFVCMSTFAKAPPSIVEPFVVVAGEKETPEFVKNEILKDRREGCRRAALGLAGELPEVRYIEMQGHGHVATKAAHINLLRNLLRGIGAGRFAFSERRPRDEVVALLAQANAERWGALRAEWDRLLADEKLAHISKKTLRNLERALVKWVDAQVATLRKVSSRTPHHAKSAALHTHDHLRALGDTFDGHPSHATLAKSLENLGGASGLHREIDARDRWRAVVKLKDPDELIAALEELREEYRDTEYGANRTIELLRALGVE